MGIDENGTAALAFHDEQQRRNFEAETEAAISYATENVPKWTRELDDLLNRVDPVDLFRRVAVVDRWRRYTSTGDSYYGSDAALQHLAARVVAKPVGDPSMRTPPTHADVSWCDQLLRAIANAQQHLILDQAGPGGGRRDLARGLLLSEHLADRMNGYRQHLLATYRPILERVREMTIRDVGFDPALLFDVIAAYQRIVNRRNAPTIDTLLDAVPPRPDNDEERQALQEQFTLRFIEQMAPPVEDIASAVADELHSDREPIAALIRTLTTPIGSAGHPDPAVNDSVAWRPIIGVDNGRGIWLQPDDSLDETLRWFDNAIADSPALRGRFDKAKQDNSETLTLDTLAKSIPAQFLHPNLLYGEPQRGETDVVVTLPGVTVLVEVKGHRLTEAGRAGRRDRVQTKIDEFVLKPLNQLDNAARHVQQHPDTWRTKKRRAVPVDPTAPIIKMLVSLEGVDPFYSNLTAINSERKPSKVETPATAAAPDPPGDVWAVSITNLMAVVDLLKTPAELIAYAAARQRSTATGSPIAFMETDALAAWLTSRTGATPPKPDEDPILDFQSDEINFYFNAVHTHPEINPRRPGSRVPPLVGDALDQMLAAHDKHWADAALTLLRIPPDKWTPLLRALDEAASPALDRPGREQRRRAHHLARGWEVEDITFEVTREPSRYADPAAHGQHNQPVKPRRLTVRTDSTGRTIHVHWDSAGDATPST